MNKTQPETQVDKGLKHQKQDKPVPDGNKNVFTALLKRACRLPASESKGETSDRA